MTTAPVNIAGMHRSGTSMVAKALHGAGLYLGDEDELMPAADENPEGFWEHEDFVAFNDAVLSELGGAWDLPPDPPADWNAPRFDQLRDVARGLARRFDGDERWGWKDPRNCLTLPLWRSALGDVATVLVVRNPLEVAKSLQKRNHFSLALGLYLWYAYNRRIADDTTPATRVVTHFDAWFGDPDGEIRRVLGPLGLLRDEAQVAALRGNATPGLKHHQLGLSDLLQANVAPEIVDLYVDLCAEAGRDAVAPGGGRRIGSAPPMRRSTFAPGFLAAGTVSLDTWIADQQGRLLTLTQANAQNEAYRKDLEGRVEERDGMIQEREGRIADRDAKIAERDRHIQGLTQEIAALRQSVQDQAEHLGQLEERLAAAQGHEREQRELLSSVHDQLMHHDTEIMSTLGAALARSAPSAPAAVYYRSVLERLRETVGQHIPETALTLVATYGDPAMLDIGRPAIEYPQGPEGIAADYTDVDDAEALAQLEALQAAGAAFLLVPSPAQAWLARHPELGRRIKERYRLATHELGLCTIYALREPPDAPAQA